MVRLGGEYWGDSTPRLINSNLEEVSTGSQVRVPTADFKANQENSQYKPLTPFTTHGKESPDDNLERRVKEEEHTRISVPDGDIYKPARLTMCGLL